MTVMMMMIDDDDDDDVDYGCITYFALDDKANQPMIIRTPRLLVPPGYHPVRGC